jgi:hypothetical protein
MASKQTLNWPGSDIFSIFFSVASGINFYLYFFSFRYSITLFISFEIKNELEVKPQAYYFPATTQDSG